VADAWWLPSWEIEIGHGLSHNDVQLSIEPDGLRFSVSIDRQARNDEGILAAFLLQASKDRQKPCYPEILICAVFPAKWETNENDSCRWC
jgi:hypothetical protein